MTIDDRFGSTATSQDGTAAGRSAEYDDGLTAQDTVRTAPIPDVSTGTAATGDYGSRGAAGLAGADDGDTVTRDETSDLISADKVQGTAVYDASGERLGTIDSIMLGKVSGKVAYAVMSFGGFLGIGERYHPLPWNVLTYDEAKGGYNIAHSADDLRAAPNYSRDEVCAFDYGARGGEIDDYYGVNTGRGTVGPNTGSSTGGVARPA